MSRRCLTHMPSSVMVICHSEPYRLTLVVLRLKCLRSRSQRR
ncbi:MAG: hypothetical protein ACTS73_08025 [Arsenophonus sp. NEOnobi-MAG3]